MPSKQTVLGEGGQVCFNASCMGVLGDAPGFEFEPGSSITVVESFHYDSDTSAKQLEQEFVYGNPAT